jgi:hypothetical protein
MELASAIGAGALWLGVFAALVVVVRWGHGTPTGRAMLIAYPAFVAAQVVLANVLGAAGALTSAGVRVAYLAGLAAALAGLALQRRRRHPRDAATPFNDTPRPQHALFTLVAPVHIWDVLAYHMPMVASYIQNGSLDAWPTQDLRQIYRVNAGELQMLNIALLARSDAWVELPNLLGLAVVLTWPASSWRGSRSGRPRSRTLVVLLVLTAPQIVIGAGEREERPRPSRPPSCAPSTG